MFSFVLVYGSRMCVLSPCRLQCDLPDAKVPRELLDSFCKEHGFVAWYETSARTNHNIEESVRGLVSGILSHQGELALRARKSYYSRLYVFALLCTGGVRSRHVSCLSAHTLFSPNPAVALRCRRLRGSACAPADQVFHTGSRFDGKEGRASQRGGGLLWIVQE